MRFERSVREIMFLPVVVFVNIMSVTFGLPTLLTEQQTSDNEVISYDFPFVTRAEWQARKAKLTLPLSPVPYVVIHHSYMPPACKTGSQCKKAMRDMQNFHMDERGWWDIGYSFAVGSDGVAYEGRGWKVLGAHALHFNTVSIGICLIGDWTTELPPAVQMKTAKALIAAGVKQGYVLSDYKLIGHRQVRETVCPGNQLYQEIQSWDHYSPYPASHIDLLDMNEISEKVKEVIKGNATYVA